MTYDVTASLLTHAGLARVVNQDRGRYVRPHDADLLARKGVLMIVADGMGGHAGGEVASRLAVDAIHRVYYSSTADPHTALRESVEHANREIHAAARQDASLTGMGTTCVAVAVVGETAIGAHVGDSRAYLLRGGLIRRLTEDHSAVARLEASGLITPEEARCHMDRNVLLRALGTRAHVEVTMWDAPLEVAAGDRFLLCSDGLHGVVVEEELQSVLAAATLGEACHELLALALMRGGPDNVTVGVLEVAPSATAASTRDTREMRLVS